MIKRICALLLSCLLFFSSATTAVACDEKQTTTHIANEARGVEGKKNSAKYYIDLKKYEYKYLEVLKSYVPRLLKKEEFFQSAF